MDLNTISKVPSELTVSVSIVLNTKNRSKTGQMWSIDGIPENYWGWKFYRHLIDQQWLVLTSSKSKISESDCRASIRDDKSSKSGHTQFNVASPVIGAGSGVPKMDCPVWYFGSDLIVIGVSPVIKRAWLGTPEKVKPTPRKLPPGLYMVS